MFESLLGRKFTAKCKHAIKCIQERLKPVRNRKQAVVNIFRKDIADLLRSGNDAHAFGRTDGLIAEMNRLTCYDMIQLFCENVLLQLSSLQKQRECPEENREAVSTLIFAARFSDLPELCDLRHLFTTRYGNAMEASVNSQFKEKSASQAFSVTRKLQLMKDIASEFSVNWDSESLECKITKNDHPKNGNSLRDNKSVLVGTKDGTLKHVVTEAKDIHVVSHEPEPPRKTKIRANEPKNVTPSPIDYSFPPVKPEKLKDDCSTEDWQRKHDLHKVTPRAQEVPGSIDPEDKMVERPKTKDGSRARSKVPPSREVNGADAEDWGNDDIAYKRPSRARVGPNPVGQEGNITEKSKLKDGHIITNVDSPFVEQESNGIETKESQNTVYKRSPRAKMNNAPERRQAAGRQEFEDNGKPTEGPQHPQLKDVNDVVHERSAKCEQDSDLATQEGRIVEPQKTKKERAFLLIPPPYVKNPAGRVGDNTEHAKPPSRTTREGVLEASDKSNNGGFKDLPREELAVDDVKPKPRSVRRKQHEPRVGQEMDGNVHGDVPVIPIPRGQRRPSSRRNASATRDGCDQEEIVVDRLLMHYSKKGIPDQPSNRRTKTKAVGDNGAGNYQTNVGHRIPKPEDDANGNREARAYQAHGRYRIPKADPLQSPPSTHVVQDGETVVHQTHGRHQVHRPDPVHPPERAVSLPPHPVTPKEEARGHQRVMSMQPDSLSPSGGRAHPRLPDYEELAARFAALRKGSEVRRGPASPV